ncbi:uncharacterized protein [Linepithema humile]|uniref:uncharacterized protein n=1 Tax=Linepithema humile TaxID=83485 RepID=UPI00351DFB25
MSHLPGPSTAKEQLLTTKEIDDKRERLLENKDFKGELTNALKHCNSLLKAEDFLTNTPPDQISSVSVVMGEVICEEIIKILGDRQIVAEHDLILCDESDGEEIYEELKTEENENYEPEEFESAPYQHITLEYKARTVALAEAYPKWSLAILHKKGCSRLKRRDDLKKWKKDVKNGGTRRDKWMHIDAETFDRFVEARASCEQVTNRTIQQWAVTAAFPYISKQFTFNASGPWVDKFKKRHKIKQRQITKYVSEKDCATMEETLKAAEKFQTQIRAVIPQFEEDFILNTDQTGCHYNSTYNVIYEHKGIKTVLVKKNLNKVIHSYTARYTLSASGKIIPYVFLCMQEPSGIFGPLVKKNIDKFSDEYKNVIVTCSKAGKLTTELYKKFLTSIISPYVKKNKFLFIIDSWGGHTNPALYDEIFEGEKGEATCTLKVIPPKCTPLCQPCNVYFYRQVKIFLMRLQNAPITLLQEQREIASREDAIKIHSLILHQLSAPIFVPMIKYAWFASKLTSDRAIFLNVTEVCFPTSLLGKKCTCEKVAFVKCSWCKSVLCFICFFDRYHPKVCKTLQHDK